MAEQDVLWLDGVVIKEAIGGFEHGVGPTGFRQRSSGVLGEDMHECHQARVVRRTSPRSALANSVTAQLVSSERWLMPHSFINGLLWGML
jgi:hypothetical protein